MAVISTALAGLHPYDAMVKVVASRTEAPVCWWYLGTLYIEAPGVDPVVVCHSRTLMVFRVRHLSQDEMTVDWTEACLLIDPVHLQPMTRYRNPVTGRQASVKPTFVDGPVSYTFKRTQDGVSLDLVQPMTTVNRAAIEASEVSGRLVFTQVEDKVRPVMTVEPGAAPKTIDLVSILTFCADPAEVADPAVDWAASTGVYNATALGPMAEWMGFDAGLGKTVIRGNLIKAHPDERVDQTVWDILQAAFPDFFDGGRAAPDWSSVFPNEA